MPPADAREFDVVGFTDFLLTQLLRRRGRLLHSDFRSDEGRWRLVTGGAEEVIAVTPGVGRFRMLLAHFAVRFEMRDYYGDFVMGTLVQRGATHPFALYTGNDQLRGYWLRLYVR